LLGLFPPNGARQDFSIAGTMTEQILKTIAVAKIAIDCNSDSQTGGSTVVPGGRSTVKLCDDLSKHVGMRP
jgi:hypothetical protein